MTSKEALERLNEKLLRYDEHYDYADIEIIKQDLNDFQKLIYILTRYLKVRVEIDYALMFVKLSHEDLDEFERIINNYVEDE